MFSKRGISLGVNTIIVIILALLVLIIMVIIFSGPSNEFLNTIRNQLGIGKTLLNETRI